MTLGDLIAKIKDFIRGMEAFSFFFFMMTCVAVFASENDSRNALKELCTGPEFGTLVLAYFSGTL